MSAFKSSGGKTYRTIAPADARAALAGLQPSVNLMRVWYFHFARFGHRPFFNSQDHQRDAAGV